MLQVGDPAPWFIAPTSSNPAYAWSTVAGRFVVLSFFGSAGDPAIQQMLSDIRQRRDLFNDARAAFFGVSNDPQDRDLARVTESVPGFRFFWDFGAGLANRYGLLQRGPDAKQAALIRASFIMDPALRVLHVLPLLDPIEHGLALLRIVETLPIEGGVPAIDGPAPVLMVPRVFEPEFCRELIALYDTNGGEDSGYMKTDPATGRTVGEINYHHKRRRDCYIVDETLRTSVRQRIERRLLPEIRRAFCFGATRLERYLIACYDASEGGYFLPHRDNTTKGTAHRRFAVTLNLNAEDYEGGDLRFPEYGRRCYRASTGGAVVFSCSLLHEATPVTRGRRYCVLPFLYDDAAAGVREQNLGFLAPENGGMVNAASTDDP